MSKCNEKATKKQRDSINHFDYFDSQSICMNKQQYVLMNGCDKIKLISVPNNKKYDDVGCISLLTMANGSTKYKEWRIFKNARHAAECFIANGDWKLISTGELKQ